MLCLRPLFDLLLLELKQFDPVLHRLELILCFFFSFDLLLHFDTFGIEKFFVIDNIYGSTICWRFVVYDTWIAKWSFNLRKVISIWNAFRTSGLLTLIQPSWIILTTYSFCPILMLKSSWLPTRISPILIKHLLRWIDPSLKWLLLLHIKPSIAAQLRSSSRCWWISNTLQSSPLVER